LVKQKQLLSAFKKGTMQAAKSTPPH
jgi:hypothetical protein